MCFAHPKNLSNQGKGCVASLSLGLRAYLRSIEDEFPWCKDFPSLREMLPVNRYITVSYLPQNS